MRHGLNDVNVYSPVFDVVLLHNVLYVCAEIAGQFYAGWASADYDVVKIWFVVGDDLFVQVPLEPLRLDERLDTKCVFFEPRYSEVILDDTKCDPVPPVAV